MNSKFGMVDNIRV